MSELLDIEKILLIKREFTIEAADNGGWIVRTYKVRSFNAAFTDWEDMALWLDGMFGVEAAERQIDEALTPAAGG